MTGALIEGIAGASFVGQLTFRCVRRLESFNPLFPIRENT